MLIEVIAIRAEDVEAAAAGGADRIELVTGIAEGGLTPSVGLVESAVKASALPVNAMVRPHSQSFRYSEADLAIMLWDVGAIREAGAAGIVVGMLTETGEIDRSALERVLRAAEGLDVTFHRAFDEAADQFAALRVLAQYQQISRVLTAGGTRPAPQSAPHLRQLREEADRLGGIRILGGYGLHADNIGPFVQESGVHEVHIGSGVRQGGSFMEPLLPDNVARIKRILSS
ncbi:copper homeostasis protein CutC [Paenibacillus sp. LHD-117]|uniref:copper homeostasis protein CutC n=1 Tax=Paenibacillus sp. LHD-117 TaxID=3071412 RepID=UPI0027E20602|nr:copper homeostasis protein CutC [Paenibacillus sp. LHD-117]MDQ6422729.1 copper homeostasis protein CutC [Paenibacillus sp. LHD-117]